MCVSRSRSQRAIPPVNHSQGSLRLQKTEEALSHVWWEETPTYFRRSRTSRIELRMKDPTAEKDTWDFPVVGTQYTALGLRGAVNLKVGTPVQLVPEPTNHYDPFALKVMCGNDHVGYVPAKGWSCSQCWKPVQSFDSYCKACGADSQYFVQGGLSRRLTNLKAIEQEHVCFISAISPEDEFAPVKVTLMLK